MLAGMLDAFISWNDTVDPSGCNAGQEHYMESSRDPERTPMQWNDGHMAGVCVCVSYYFKRDIVA